MRVRFDARVSFPGRAGLLGSTYVDRFGGMRMKSAITMKQWLPLAGMTCSAFVFNTSEFMPIGLLTDIAASFGLSEAQAGIMISVYAWSLPPRTPSSGRSPRSQRPALLLRSTARLP